MLRLAAALIFFSFPAIAQDATPITNWGAKGDGITDNSPALIAALAQISAKGGYVSLPIDESGGIYYYTIPLVLTPLALNNVGIVGPGTLKPSTDMTGAALTIIGNAGPPWNTTIRGLTIDFSNNTGLTYGILVQGTTLLDIERNAFRTDNSGAFAPNFAVIGIKTSIDGNSATNAFWTTIRGNSFGAWSGPSGNPSYCILMLGQANAMQISNNKIGGCATGVAGLPDASNGDNSNGAVISGNWFEGLTTAILNTGNPAPATWSDGWVIRDNRTEAAATFFKMNSTGASPLNHVAPPYLESNLLVGVSAYISNPLKGKYYSREPGNYPGSNTGMIGAPPPIPGASCVGRPTSRFTVSSGVVVRC